MLQEVVEPVLSYKYLSFTEKQQGACNPPHSTSFQRKGRKGPFCPGSVLKATHFSKNRSQKAQQERAAEAAESLDIAQQEQTQISHLLRNSSTSQWLDPLHPDKWMEKQKEEYEHGKVHILIAHCLAHRSLGEKMPIHKLTHKTVSKHKLKLMPVIILMHIHLAFLFTHKFYIVLKLCCYSILLFHGFPHLKNPKSQQLQKITNIKAMKILQLSRLNVLLALIPHYSTKNILSPTSQSIMNHTK